MTGLDVLRRCSWYKKDMERLKLRLDCVRDAALRVTRSADATGHGGQTDKMGDYAAKVDEIEREMQRRREQYARDVGTAARLIERLDPVQGSVLYMRMVQGKSVQQICAQLYYGESTVKKLLREGRAELETIVL